MVYPSRFVEFFGPSMWRTMHAVAFTYPENPTPEERMQYIDFFRSIGPVIPCPSCSTHYMEYLDKHPIDADNTDSLAKWVYDLHEDVNRRSNKKGLTWEQVKDDYTGWNREKSDEMNRGNRQAALRKIADPHFGRAVQMRGGKENITGEDAGSAMLRAGAVIAVALGALYMVKRTTSKKTEEARS
jgi:hypothetical protein